MLIEHYYYWFHAVAPLYAALYTLLEEIFHCMRYLESYWHYIIMHAAFMLFDATITDCAMPLMPISMPPWAAHYRFFTFCPLHDAFAITHATMSHFMPHAPAEQIDYFITRRAMRHYYAMRDADFAPFVIAIMILFHRWLRSHYAMLPRDYFTRHFAIRHDASIHTPFISPTWFQHYINYWCLRSHAMRATLELSADTMIVGVTYYCQHIWELLLIYWYALMLLMLLAPFTIITIFCHWAWFAFMRFDIYAPLCHYMLHWLFIILRHYFITHYFFFWCFIIRWVGTLYFYYAYAAFRHWYHYWFILLPLLLLYYMMPLHYICRWQMLLFAKISLVIAYAYFCYWRRHIIIPGFSIIHYVFIIIVLPLATIIFHTTIRPTLRQLSAYADYYHCHYDCHIMAIADSRHYCRWRYWHYYCILLLLPHFIFIFARHDIAAPLFFILYFHYAFLHYATLYLLYEMLLYIIYCFDIDFFIAMQPLFYYYTPFIMPMLFLMPLHIILLLLFYNTPPLIWAHLFTLTLLFALYYITCRFLLFYIIFSAMAYIVYISLFSLYCYAIIDCCFLMIFYYYAIAAIFMPDMIIAYFISYTPIFHYAIPPLILLFIS